MAQAAPLRTLMISANVGSLFDDPENLFPTWFKSFYQAVAEKDPDFIAIHCQEVGGKNFEESMPNVHKWIEDLRQSETLKNFDRMRAFLDEDFQTAATFTALGSLYFIHSRVQSATIWDFTLSKFLPIEGKVIHGGSIESVSEKEKKKFPLKYFPNRVWSRKGYLRTKWRFGATEFDLVNTHLFHDANNLDCLAETPSVYAMHRRRAFQWTLGQLNGGDEETELAADDELKVPAFVFGDFNFRLDFKAYAKRVVGSCARRETRDASGKLTKVEFVDSEGVNSTSLRLTVGKKLFDRFDNSGEFIENNNSWLNSLDFESRQFDNHLFEFPVTFPPTYPFSEECPSVNSEAAVTYMRTRLPSWCDRILCSHSTRRIILCPPESPTQYGVLGLRQCMGDHKPVYLCTMLDTAGADAADAAGIQPTLSKLPPPPLLSRMLDQPGVQVKMTQQCDGAVYVQVRRDGATVCVFRETQV